MARINIAAQTLAGGYPALPVAAGSADLVWTAADTTDHNDTALVSGKTVVLARNVGGSSHNVTVTSTADAENRTGDLGPYALAAGAVARFGPFLGIGWAQTGRLQFEGDHADVEFAVVTLPST